MIGLNYKGTILVTPFNRNDQSLIPSKKEESAPGLPSRKEQIY